MSISCASPMCLSKNALKWNTFTPLFRPTPVAQFFRVPLPSVLIPSANVLSYPEFGVTGRVNFSKNFIKLYQVDICQKRLSYDEAHRVTGNTSVAGQLLADMTTMRESRASGTYPSASTRSPSTTSPKSSSSWPPPFSFWGPGRNRALRT